MQTRALALAVLMAGCGSSTPSGGDGGSTGGPHNWLAGARGTLASSSDGQRYVTASSGTNADLFALFCVGQKVGWAAGAAGTLLSTTDGGATWTARPTGVATTLRAVAFADVEYGIAAGDAATLLRSLDGGATWSAATVSGVPATAALYAAAIARDRSLAWAAGDHVVLRSTDGGQTFAAVASLPSARWRAIKFAADAQHGVLVGDGGAVMLTSDGGATWRAARSAPLDLRGVSITPDGTRIVAVGGAGIVWRSTDAGATWSLVSTGAPTLNAIGFIDDLPAQGWAVGARGALLHTGDGGATFQTLAAPLAVDFNAVEDFN